MRQKSLLQFSIHISYHYWCSIKGQVQVLLNYNLIRTFLLLLVECGKLL